MHSTIPCNDTLRLSYDYFVFLSDPYYINWATVHSMQNCLFYSGKEDFLMKLV